MPWSSRTWPAACSASYRDPWVSPQRRLQPPWRPNGHAGQRSFGATVLRCKRKQASASQGAGTATGRAIRGRTWRCHRTLPGSPRPPRCLDGGSLEMSVHAVTVRAVAEMLRDRRESSRAAARHGKAGGGPAVRAGLRDLMVGCAAPGTSAGPGSPIVTRGCLGALAGFRRRRGVTTSGRKERRAAPA